jgi:hypothetical protein
VIVAVDVHPPLSAGVSTFDEILSTSTVAPGSGVVAITGISSNRSDGTELASGAGAANPPPKTATKAAPDNTNSKVSDRTCFRIEIGMPYSSEPDKAQRMVPEAHKTKEVFPNFRCGSNWCLSMEARRLRSPTYESGVAQNIKQLNNVWQTSMLIVRASVGTQRQLLLSADADQKERFAGRLPWNARGTGGEVIRREIRKKSLGC